jgi:hypothetical protein
MGFWSGLLKGAATVAAPFTGGASLAAIPVIDGIGNAVQAGAGVAGDLAKGREAGRQSEFQNSVVRNQQDLRQRQFANESQSDAFHKSMLGALGMNVQDASINRPDGVPNTSMSGGLRPSALGMEGRAAAGMLHGQAMKRLHDGEKFDKLADTKGNWIDTTLGTIGAIGKGLDGFEARNTADEQNSMIRDMLKKAGDQSSSTAGSAGSVTAQTVPPPGATPVTEWTPPMPNVSTGWSWQAPDYGILPPDYTHGIGGQGGYGGGKPSIWGQLFGAR